MEKNTKPDRNAPGVPAVVDRSTFQTKVEALRIREKERMKEGDRVFEAYWTTRRGVEAMGNTYPLLDMTVYGRQEWWEDSPTSWPQPWKDDEKENPFCSEGRPIVQWPRVKAGHSDDLGTG